MEYNFKEVNNMKGEKVLYCEDFFDEHKEWYKLIDDSVKWESFNVKVHDKVFPQPRESFYMADDKHQYKYSGFDRIPEKWSVAVIEMKKVLEKVLVDIEPNHPKLNAVLGNKYNNGSNYIGFHSDSESDLDDDAFIVSVSLGAERDFVFKHIETGKKVSIKLKSGSVLLMGGDCQKNWTHGLPKRLKIKEPRINLTFRRIIKRNKNETQ